ncbi:MULTISPECIES: activator-dependent family glycosyltransferase [Streptomyces]|uniref:activator-dependent family glycosyltransferase n=1 Tax=Streptomyces TaxID=1883 RepID=UPI0019634590|nr:MULTISPECIES: activator-dependent family glycosyltransferase [Streptomyces]QRX94012.1 activator-dependent family glycosyltransferase [Streptomyces noursei]UJB43730.1 activator-dependent family glycosyltransferase [Streptomyces sp. A1-5]
MRVLFTSFAHNTHFYTLAPLAWAFRAAGHEVTVASQPSLTDTITQAGLPAVPVGVDHAVQEFEQRQSNRNSEHPEINFAETRPEIVTWDYALGLQSMMTPLMYAKVNDTMVDDLVEFARQWQPDLVIWEPFTYAGAVAARVTGAAHARLLWGPDVQLRARKLFLQRQAEQPVEHRDDPLAEWLTWTLDRYGCTFDEEIVTGQWTIDSTPESTRLPLDQHVVPMRYVPYNGTSVIPDWLREPPKRPRVCLTLGVSAREVLGGDAVSISDLIEATADLDIELVATLDASQRDLLASVPDNTRIVDFVPMHALLPTCSAIIYHGGAGTWSTAMLAGVPHIMLAEQYDTVLKAERIEELGAGLFIRPNTLTAQGLRDMVVRVLEEPSFRAAAERLRQEVLAEPTPGELVPVLERLTAEHRTRPEVPVG